MPRAPATRNTDGRDARNDQAPYRLCARPRIAIVVANGPADVLPTGAERLQEAALGVCAALLGIVGKLGGYRGMEAEGKLQQMKGKVESKIGDVKDR